MIEVFDASLRRVAILSPPGGIVTWKMARCVVWEIAAIMEVSTSAAMCPSFPHFPGWKACIRRHKCLQT